MTEPPVSPERQMARLKIYKNLASGIEEAVDRYRDFPRDELSNGQFAAQILIAITKHKVGFYLDDEAAE